MPPYPRDSDDGSSSESDDTSTDTTTDDGEDESTETTTSSEDNFSPAQSGAVVKNAPHDEEFVVPGASSSTAPAPAAAPAASRQPAAAAAPAAAPAGKQAGITVQNQKHDEEFSVSGVPGASSSTTQQQPRPGAAPAANAAPAGRGGKIQNDHADEFEDVEDDMDDDDDVPTPQKAPARQPAGATAAAGTANVKPIPAGGSMVRNQHQDEEYAVAPSTIAAPKKMPAAVAALAPKAAPAAAPGPVNTSNGGSRMAPPSDDDDSESEATGSDDDELPSMANVQRQPAGGAAAPTGPPITSVEYNPADYAAVTNSAPADVRDLFAYITAYQPTTTELPAKLKPFIPDYIPSVGDIDTFCKIPRPDDKTDNFGLVVVDEPSSRMSNPAIIHAWLANLENVSQKFIEGILSSVDDAANNPQLIDRWIEDLRETQAKKAPPTVYYSKPMPSIDSLMQAWPPGFEDVLNSDLQLPPPGINLDLEQYVRMLCAILDIPVHNNVTESLHVMFTLYLEFRENQHFKAS